MAVNSSESVRILGLKELTTALRALEVGMGPELGRAHKRVAELVADKARSMGGGLGGVAGKAAPDVNASASQQGARLTYGGKPYSMGAEFGAVGYRQFKAWRGSSHEAGYFLFPAIRASHDEITVLYMEELTKITALAFPS